MESPVHATTFISTNVNTPADRYFQGYCFHDTDYIFGEEGLKKFETITGRQISGGLDGCYVFVRRIDDSFVFTNDYAGYKILYYYHDGRNWAVSNSLSKIVDFLREIGVRVTPNYSQISSIMTAGSSSSQLSSFESSVRDVRMVPRGFDLIVSVDKITLKKWDPIDKIEYKTGLSNHLDLWAGRFETLVLDNRMGLTTDITGGVDSRTNFGLLALAKSRLDGEGSLPRLNCGSTPTNTEDLDVALKLGEHFGLEINDNRRFARYNLTPEESYQTFRDLNVGTSFTLYMPVEGPHPYKVSIGGGGGEIHRKFYEGHINSKDENLLFSDYASRLKDKWLSSEYIRNCQDAIKVATPPGADPLRAYYREFRHRFHVGRAPRYGVALTPLDSVTADLTQSQAGYDRLNDGQFNYDVLGSLNKDLLEMPFDKPSKSPSTSVRSRLTIATISQTPRPGKVWSAEPEQRTVARSAVKRNERLKKGFESAISDPFVTDFWNKETFSAAEGLLEKLISGKGIGNAVNGKPISAILAAHLASPNY